VNQKLLMSFSRNYKNGCELLYKFEISTKFGWTYGKFEVNASNDQNNANSFITLRPLKQIYGERGRSGHINIFSSDNRYLRNRWNDINYGIKYGGGEYDLKHLEEAKKSLFEKGFHVFAFEWNKREMIWKIDETIIHYQSLDTYFKKSETGNFYDKRGQPFDHEFRLELATTLDTADRNEQINERLTDSKFIIDYVKYYKWNQTEQQMDVACIRNNSTNDNRVVEIVITTIGSIVLILLIISNLFLYFKMKKSKKISKDIIKKKNVKRKLNDAYEHYNELQLSRNYDENYVTPCVYVSSFETRSYTEILP